MEIKIDMLNGKDAYRLMSQIIVPRPIAWVSTISTDGISNLAPFSFFQGVTSRPPTLLFIPVNDRLGKKKDTIRNIESVPEFVINIADVNLKNILDKTATPLPYSESEFEEFNIDCEPSSLVRPPRVKDAPIAMECTLDRIIEIGEEAFAANVVFGRIHIVHMHQRFVTNQGEYDLKDFKPLARLGNHYGSVIDLMND